MSITEIIPPKSGIIEEIIHISDVHIRNGDEILCRFNEYKQVFELLFGDLKRMDSVKRGTAAIVLTGDQFHHKSKLETPGIKLFMMLMTNLGSIAPTYIILGNHDFRQEQIDEGIDFLEAFGDSLPPNVCFLQETGLYKAANVGFGLVSVKDTLRLGSGSGMCDSLPDFPIPSFGSDVTHTAALFHGTMCNSKYTDTRTSDDGYPWAWMDVGYNLALLGDIHKQQVFPTRKSGLQAAYAGSLIQQNFGESLSEGHGFIVWKLKPDRTAELVKHDVYNDYGFVKLSIKKGEWICGGKTLMECVKKENFPTKLKLRIYGGYNPEEFQSLQMILNGKEYHIDDCVIQDDNNLERSSDYKSEVLLESFMKANGIENYEIPDIEEVKIQAKEEWSEELKRVAHKKNLEIDKEFSNFKSITENIQQTRKVCIRYMEWSGLLCYSEHNWIDFDTMKGATNLISAKNGGGKSSFLEIICLAIFGKPIPTRSTKGNSHALIAKSKKVDSKSMTSIHVVVFGITYRIDRPFDNDGKQKGRNTGVYRLNEGTWEIVCVDPPKTNDWVLKNLGDIHGFLMTTLITQSNDDDFLSMKPAEQRDHLEQLVGMKEANAMAVLFKHCHQYMKSFKNSLDLAYGGQEKNFAIEDESSLGDAINAYDNERIRLKLLEDKVKTNWGKSKVSDLEKSHEEINDELSELSMTMEQYKSCNVQETTERIADIKAKRNYKKENTTSDVKEATYDVKADDYRSLLRRVVKLGENLNERSRIIQELHPPCPKPKQVSDEDYVYYTEKLNKVIRVSKEHEMFIENQPKPMFCEDSIVELEKEVEEEMKCPQPSIEEYTKAKVELNEVQKSIDTTQDEYEEQCEYITSLEEMEDKLNEKSKCIVKVSQPLIQKAILCSTLEELRNNECLVEMKQNDYERCIKKRELWQKQNSEILTIENEFFQIDFTIVEVEKSLSDLPFNPQCKACCTQPARKQLASLKRKKDELLEMKRRLIEDKVDEPKEFDELKLWIENYEKNVVLKDEYEELLLKWNIFEEYTSAYSAIEEETSTLRKNIRQNRMKQRSILDTIKIHKEQLSKIKNTIKDYKAHESMKTHWDERLAFVASIKAQWFLYKKSERTHKIKSKYDEYTKKLSELKSVCDQNKLYDAYEYELQHKRAEMEKLEMEQGKMKQMIAVYEYKESVVAFDHEEKELNKKISENQIRNSIEEKYSYWRSVFELKGEYEEQKVLTNNIEKSRIVLQELYSERVRIEHSILENAKQLTKLQKIRSEQDALQTKVQKLLELGIIFDKYRAWLYEEHVLPKLISRANRFIGTVEPNLKLCYNMLQDGTFCFTAQNEIHEVALEKTSGFEYFILSTCLRLAFITLTLGEGALGGQLMIDEGFTACDGNHLNKIPNFLQLLLGKFDSIILVSHIERIKESVDNTILIKDKKIRHGSQYDFSKPINRKRKPKN